MLDTADTVLPWKKSKNWDKLSTVLSEATTSTLSSLTVEITDTMEILKGIYEKYHLMDLKMMH